MRSLDILKKRKSSMEQPFHIVHSTVPSSQVRQMADKFIFIGKHSIYKIDNLIALRLGEGMPPKKYHLC